MTALEIRNRILECVTLFGFRDGNVDPYYIPENQRNEYLLCYNGPEQTVYDIDAVMDTPFIAGQTLSELADKITITEY